jgi:hypothetical protein
MECGTSHLKISFVALVDVKERSCRLGVQKSVQGIFFPLTGGRCRYAGGMAAAQQFSFLTLHHTRWYSLWVEVVATSHSCSLTRLLSYDRSRLGSFLI